MQIRAHIDRAQRCRPHAQLEYHVPRKGELMLPCSSSRIRRPKLFCARVSGFDLVDEALDGCYGGRRGLSVVHESPETTFHSAPVVSAALDIPTGTLNAWAAKGWLDALSTPSAGQGRKRSYSTIDFLVVSLVKAASDFRMNPGLEFHNFAPEAVRSWYAHPDVVKQVIVRFYTMPERLTSISYNDEAMRKPPRPGWTISIAFDLRSIFEPALEALAKQEERKHRQQTGTTIVEPASPLLTAIKCTK
jgi:hypothetical protein